MPLLMTVMVLRNVAPQRSSLLTPKWARYLTLTRTPLHKGAFHEEERPLSRTPHRRRVPWTQRGSRGMGLGRATPCSRARWYQRRADW